MKFTVTERNFSVSGNSPLQGKVAIVTGASSGIGSAIVRALTRNGAKVAMAARRVDRMKDLEHVVKTEGGIAILVKTDVLDRQEVRWSFSNAFFHCRNKTYLCGRASVQGASDPL